MAGQYIEPMHPRALIDRIATPLGRLPSQCAVCRGWARSRLCDECLQRFAVARPRCWRCAIDVPDGVPICGACLTRPPPFAHAVAAVDYAPPWNELVRRFKFDDALDLADALSQCLLDAVRRRDAPRADRVLPVPLAAARLRERGYNQAWELARRVARCLHCAADAHLLLRLKDTPHQLALPPDRRAANVRGAFALEPRRRRELEGLDVAIVDDVMTTGATAAEIATTLLQTGARSVQVWVLARTPRPEDG